VTILGRNAVNAGIQLGMYYRRQSRSLVVFLLLPAMGACEPLVQIAKERDAGVDENGATGGSGATSSAMGGSPTDVTATGGTPGIGASCVSVTPCGGNMVGTWDVASSCLTVSGQVDLSAHLQCTSAPVTGSLQVTGTWAANADGSYWDNTITTGIEQLTLPDSCLNFTGGTRESCHQVTGAVLESLTNMSVGCLCVAPPCNCATDNQSVSGDCTAAAGGGCNCTFTVNQPGGIGVLPLKKVGGTYTNSGSEFTTDGSTRYSYCASGNALTVTPQTTTVPPQTTSPTTTGTIVLERGVSSCSNVTPCGGNVVGTWTVASSCLTVGGGLDLTMLGIGCTFAPVAGSLQVSGTFTAKSDGSFVDNTTTTGSEQFTLAPSCLLVSGTTVTCDNIGVIFPAIGFASATCTSTGGGVCNCTGTVNQNGGIGLVDWNAATTGSYSTSSDVLKTTDGSSSWPYSYCASDNTLTMTPETMSPTITGKIELQKQ